MSSNSSNSIFDKFTHQYQVNKTLRFRLVPVSGTEQPHSGQIDLSKLKNPASKTSEHIKNKRLLKTDEDLAQKYKQAKKIIDEYHKDYMDQRLSEFVFNEEDLQKFSEIYHQLKNDKTNEELKKI